MADQEKQQDTPKPIWIRIDPSKVIDQEVSILDVSATWNGVRGYVRKWDTEKGEVLIETYGYFGSVERKNKKDTLYRIRFSEEKVSLSSTGEQIAFWQLPEKEKPS